MVKYSKKNKKYKKKTRKQRGGMFFSPKAVEKAKASRNAETAAAQAKVNSNSNAATLKKKYSDIESHVKIITITNPQQMAPLIRILNNMKNTQTEQHKLNNYFMLKSIVTKDVLENIEQMITAINNYNIAVEQNNLKTKQEAASDYNKLFDNIPQDFINFGEYNKYIGESKLPIT